MVKIRIGFSSKLYDFDSKKEAFDWVAENHGKCMISLLTYENGSLENMDRYEFDGQRFIKEKILIS